MAGPQAVRAADPRGTRSPRPARSGRRASLLAAAALALLAVAGCGSAGAPPSPGTTGPSAPGGSQGSQATQATQDSAAAGSLPASVPAPGGATTAPTGAAADGGPVSGATVLAAAWLSYTQLPIGSGLQWQGGPVTPQVNDAPENNLGSCLSGNPVQVGAGAQWQTEGGIFHHAGSTEAVSQVYEAQYFFASTAAAVGGLAAVENAYVQCRQAAARETGVVDTITATRQSADTFAVLRTVRTGAGAPTSTPTVGSDSHEYFAQDGNVVYFVGFYGDSGIDGTDQDVALLTRMLAALAAYR